MQIINISSMEAAAVQMPQLISSNTPFIMYLVQPEESVIVGSGNDVDRDEVAKRGLFVTEIGTFGGTIVMNKGDFGVAVFGPLTETKRLFVSLWQLFISNWASYGVPAELLDNDIVVDGNKCCAISRTNIGDNVLFLLQVSINVDLEAIRAICKKPMVKTPKGLSEYGITTANVSELFNNWLYFNFPEEMYERDTH